MVDALREIRCALVEDGLLIDLRPLLGEPVIEVVSARETEAVGHAIQTPEDSEHDQAANRAMAQAEERGWFKLEREECFPFYYYWDSPSQMQEYLSEEWEGAVLVSEDAWAGIRAKWAIANADAQLRMPLRMLIARYRARQSP